MNQFIEGVKTLFSTIQHALAHYYTITLKYEQLLDQI